MKTRNIRILFLASAILLTIFVIACESSALTIATENRTDQMAESLGTPETLRIPYDITYREAFERGALPYDKGTILLKLANSSRPLSRNLKNGGVARLTPIIVGEHATWYKATLAEGTPAIAAMPNLRMLPEVLIAEYNFLYQAEMAPLEDDPLAVNQWHLSEYGIPEAWAYLEQRGLDAGGGPNIVVAVIDTGVDLTHPDLEGALWTNGIDVPNGIDDDNNGYVDDVHGVNVVSDDRFESGNPMDDHGHGTHVAGIIGARNNAIGVVGVAFNVKIMAIKAGTAAGTFAQADIAEAIIYAYENGADVINMSFGGQAISIAVQDALMTAYNRSVLVASAGNTARPNEASDFDLPAVNYPAALPYVIGVMSVDSSGRESGFSNWDVLSYNGIEYELYVGGENIVSTLPGNRYASWSGTSMAAPIVSAMAAMIRTAYPDRDRYPNKFIIGQLLSTSSTKAQCADPDRHTKEFIPHRMASIVNLYEALTTMPKPDVRLFEQYIFDDPAFDVKNNGDGVVDNNETIAIGFVLHNRWGMSKNTTLTFDTLNEFGLSSPYVEFLTNGLDFGSVGTYSTKDFLIRDKGAIVGTTVPFLIRIAPDTPNDMPIAINVTITYQNALDETDSTVYTRIDTFTIIVRNGVVLPNIIASDMTLTKDNFYIIPNSMVIEEGATLTVEAGTKIQFWTNDPADPYAELAIVFLKVEGRLITAGTPEEPVQLFPSELFHDFMVQIYEVGKGLVSLNYTTVINPQLDISHANHCRFENNQYGYLMSRSINGGTLFESGYQQRIEIRLAEYSIFANNGGLHDTGGTRGFYQGRYENNIFYDNAMDFSYDTAFESNVFLGNNNRLHQGSLGSVVNLNYMPNIHQDFTEIHYREATNTTYIVLHFQSNLTMYNDMAMRFERLAEAYGGHLVIVEDEAEQAYLANVIQHPVLSGLRRDPATKDLVWIDGTPAGDHVVIDYYSADAPLAVMSPWSYAFNHNFYRALIEIPMEEDAPMWTKDSVHNQWRAFYQAGKHTSFHNNAFLNRTSLFEPAKGLRFIGNGLDSVSGTTFLKSIGLAGNYWGEIHETLIQAAILDFDDYQNLVNIIHRPILEEAPDLAFPYVTSIRLYDTEGLELLTVANQTVKVVVTFSTDMDVTIPLFVRFGSVLPFADYEIPGGYVDARTWEGTYTLTTMIENGMQYFSVRGGASARDAWCVLMPDMGRFGFPLDTTLAQAMIMQGSASEDGIALTWEQDDFTTLAGYNVYRSANQDGFYIKLNKNVIPADTRSFFDATVLPGTVYYYNFTVVQTDLTESEPSGKIVIQSLDTMSPNVYHTPIPLAFTGRNLVVTAVILDNLAVHGAKVYYRVVGTQEWMSATMSRSNDRYSAILNSEYIQLVGLEYYIEASDGLNVTSSGSSEAPHLVTVQLAVEASTLGDVNGDGLVSSVDALMVLLSINDRLNLTQEQFLRADLNENGILEAWEALRILYYVSGKVQTIRPTA